MEIKRIANLLREVSMRRRGDIAYRLWTVLLKKSGLLDRRFPAVEPNFAHLEAQIVPEGDSFMETFDQQPFYAGIDDPVSAEFFAPYLEEAENSAAHTFSFLGSPTRRFPEKIDWHHSLNGDVSWPITPWHSVGYKNSQLGDIKSCWEWNRHQFFPLLTLGARVRQDEDWVNIWIHQLQTWCDQNPPEMGIHYNSNLELGLRCVSWLWAHFLARKSPAYTPEARQQFHLNLYYMARHIHKNLTFTQYTGRNNHLIGDASCLALVGLCCPHLRDAESWRKRGLSVLWKALREQVSEDGMHFEQSFGYHVFVSEFVVQILLLLRHRNQSVPDFVMPILEMMLDALLAFRLPDGSYPRINDCDDARVLPLTRSAAEQSATLFAVGAVLFRRPDFAWAAGETATLQARLLLGENGLKDLAELGREEPRKTLFSLDYSGLYCVRNHWGADADMMLFDNHRDPFPNSGHNHASSLQILLWAGGSPVLVDSGTFRYTVEAGMRNGLRGTMAHNTVTIDQRDQALPHRDFGWISKLKPGNTSMIRESAYLIIEGDHLGYQSLPDGVTHHRAVVWFMEARVWVIADRFEAKGEHHYCQHWHLPGKPVIRQENDEVFDFGDDNQTEMSIILVNSRGEAVSERGGKQSWHFESPAYGILQEKQVLRRQWTHKGPHVKWTVISASGKPEWLPDGDHLEICIRGTTYVLAANKSMVVIPS